MKHIHELAELIGEFGLKYSFKNVFSRLLHNNIWLERTIYTQLERENTKLIESLNKASSKALEKDCLHVWTFWWQGIEQLPDILKVCYASQKASMIDKDVEYHIISKDNYSDYVEIPPIIMQRMEKGEMSFTHFSDYLRVCLLEKYGGKSGHFERNKNEK